MKSKFTFFKKNKKIIYLDNSATTQKPNIVLNAIKYGYENFCFPSGKSIYKKAENSIKIIEKTKKIISENLFIGAQKENIFFTPSATISSNILINSIFNILEENDSIAIQEDCHNSVIAPWIILYKKKNLKLIFFKNNEIESLSKVENLKCICFSLISNVTGHVFDIDKLNKIIQNDTILFADGAQFFGLNCIDLNKNKIDFLYASSHKIYGPYGVSPVFISDKFKKIIQPIVFGGGNIKNIDENKTLILKEFTDSISFGSIDIPNLYAFSKACLFVKKKIYKKNLKEKYKVLINYLKEELSKNKYIKIISSENSYNILTFYHEKIHSNDIAEILSKKNICVRSGYHCSHYYFEKNKIKSTIRISIGIYNIKKEILKLAKIIKELV
jgi:cysteine desulfurase/selenocysteine lyase